MRKTRPITGLLLTTITLVLCMLAACAGSGDSDDGEQEEDTTQAESGAVTNTSEVKNATVYLQAAGGVYDQGRQFGEISIGSGSGFVVDPSGLALTNNHVVAGAGYLEVYVEGEEEPRGAQVLGRSECSDLALIKIDGGGFDYLEWRDGPIESNLDVRAAGYPTEDEAVEELPPDYTITRGIINTTEADGDTQWASVDSVLEHDALIRGGNSGGPLVDEQGKAVGVNYRTMVDTETEAPTGQRFAVSRDEAQELLERLKQGDVDSIGISGEAISLPEEETSGVAVASVVTGSPAGEAGVKGYVANEEDPTLYKEFDLITKLEGTRIAENETMEEYCKVLRGRSRPEQPLNIEVMRFKFDDEGEPTSLVRYEGVLNGGPEGKLKPVETLLGEPPPEQGQGTETSDDNGSGETAGSGYTKIEDDSGALAMEVPQGWKDVRSTGTFTFEGEEVGPSMGASTDFDAWVKGFEQPGAYLAASRELAERYPDDVQDRVLDANDQSGKCEHEGRGTDYDDGDFTGKYDIYTNCDGTDHEYHVFALVPEDRSMVVLLQTTVTSKADADAEIHILETSTISPDQI